MVEEEKKKKTKHDGVGRCWMRKRRRVCTDGVADVMLFYFSTSGVDVWDS